MSKKPRSTKGVPEAVFQKELFAYIQRKEANPGKNVKASFDYKGTSYTFERGSGTFGSGYQIKTSAGQAAKEMARNEQKRSIKLSDGEKMFMDDKYAAASERNTAEGRTGSRKLEVDHVEPRSKGGLHHPYNLRLMERGKNGSKGNKQGGFGEFESLLTETKKEFDNQDLRLYDIKTGHSPRPRLPVKYGASMVLEYGDAGLEIADNYTNGQASKTINGAINGAVDFVKDNGTKLVNGLVDTYAALKPSVSDSNTNYGQ